MKFYHISHKLVFLSFSIQIFLEVLIRVTKIYQIIYVNCLFLGVFCRCKRKCPTNLTLNGSLLRKFIQRVFKGVKHDSKGSEGLNFDFSFGVFCTFSKFCFSYNKALKIGFSVHDWDKTFIYISDKKHFQEFLCHVRQNSCHFLISN